VNVFHGRSDEPKIADIFIKKGPFLKMYTDYIRDYESMVALLDEYRQKNPAFDKCVSAFEVGCRS
jgi:FYVE, RhoGEF and PH domain containing 5/6